MNKILKGDQQEAGGRSFKSKPQLKTTEEWAQLADVAGYFAGFKEARVTYKPEYHSEIGAFLAGQSDAADSASSASLWQLALQKKNEFFKAQKERTHADRDSIIRQELADFDSLVQMS